MKNLYCTYLEFLNDDVGVVDVHWNMYESKDDELEWGSGSNQGSMTHTNTHAHQFSNQQAGNITFNKYYKRNFRCAEFMISKEGP